MAEAKVCRNKWEGYIREMDMLDFVGEQRMGGGVRFLRETDMG